MTRRRGLTAGLVALIFAAVACTVSIGTGESPSPTFPPSPTGHRPEPSASPVPTGPGSAAAALRALCIPPKMARARPDRPAKDTPPVIAEVERQVEDVRGFTFTHPVAVTALTPSQLDRRLTKSFDATYPEVYYARRTQAWRTLGVIPQDADIRTALLAFQTGQVVGFYEPANGQLVYAGDTASLGLVEHFTLAHELTHAIDDQRYDLTRINPNAEHCRDDAFQASLGAVEGSAQFFASRVLLTYPGGDLDLGGGGSMAGVPPFIVAMQLWPYTSGQAFIAALMARGGVGAVNDAIQHFPVSTEQVLHPERYPTDLPQAVDVPDLAAGLGLGWNDLDVMLVGEEFLREMLRLRLPQETADAAASGWDGGLYRAWTDGAHTAVVLRTVWDAPGDADAFAQAMTDWLGAGDTRGVVGAVRGAQVDVVFSDDPVALGRLTAS